MKKIVYALLDVLNGGKGIERTISGFKLRIPARYYKYFKPDYESGNVSLINKHLKAGMVAIDVGAHIGLLSVIMAKKVEKNGRVYSFEPTPSTFEILQKTIQINQQESIIIPQKKAVSSAPGKTFFYVTDIAAHNSNSLSDNKRNYGNEHTIEVELTSIDVFRKESNISKIDFIKIDAEGAELSVLKGATETLDSFKPQVILALHPASIINFGDNLSDIWDFVQNKGYKVFYKDNELSKDYFTSQTDLFDVFLIAK